MKAQRPELSSTEFNSLHDFYNATNGPLWRWHNVSVHSTPWNFSIPEVNPCLDDWQGLVCDCGLTSCTVEMLFLDHHNLTGHLPDSMENFSKMSQLILRGNNITGTITQSIGNMTELEILDLSYNKLYGEIPLSIGRLSKLITLNLGMNQLRKIPEELYELSSLQGLSLFNNRIEGLISSRIGNLSSLETLQLQVNAFTPQLIPKEICNLRQLKSLDVSRINLLGPFPDCLFDMTGLKSLTALGNNLFCTLNDSFGRLINLVSLDLSFSQLFGSLPSSLGNLTQLETFTAAGNLLTGSLPQSLQNLNRLQTLSVQYNLLDGKIDFLVNTNASVLYLHNNMFIGHFTFQESDLNDLVFLDVSLNQLSGPVPFNPEWRRIQIYEVYKNYFTSSVPRFANSSLVVYMAASYNFLSSSIPENLLATANHLFFIGLSGNLLTGTIPAGLGEFRGINQLLMTGNFLTGTIPDMRNNSLMVVLDLSFNQLHGKVTSSLLELRFIEQIFLEYNLLTGQIQEFLNGTLQKRLVNIDISGNEFSGSLPTDIFTDCEELSTFAASSNCLNGVISEVICESRSLVSLSLDGLTTSSNCKNIIFPRVPYLNGFTVTHFMQGTVPPCLFEMPSLQLLHLSGNGLTGSIPRNANFSLGLTNLALSHNALTGTIPTVVQLRQWSYLDLSYNKLSGTLNPDFETPPTNGSTFLEVNRLSGGVPSSLVESTSDVNILSGNIFGCNIVGSDLPKSDPDVNSYSCGSDNANNVLYAWMGTVVCVPLFVFFLIKLLSKTSLSLRSMFNEALEKYSVWKAALRQDDNRVNLTRLSIYLSEVRQGTLRLTAYCMLVLIPLYSVLKVYSSSYAIEYAWWISAMLMNGEAAAIVLFVSLMLFAMLYVRTLKGIVMKLNVRMPKEKRKKESFPVHEGIDTVLPQVTVQPPTVERIVIYCFIAILNLIIMIAVDLSYVYIVISYDSLVSTFAALALAFFRLVTNQIIIWHALPTASKLLSCLKKAAFLNVSHIVQPNLEYTAKDISFVENLTLFNNIIIPGVAIVLVLPDCFYNALISANEVTSYYSYGFCYQHTPISGFSHLCFDYTGTVVYSPAFSYSYQCSSKIVINYVPVYVLMFILAGMIIPPMKVGLKVLYDRLRESESRVSKKLRGLVELVVPQYFKEWRSDLNEKLTEIGGEPSQYERSMAARTMFGGKGDNRKKRLFSKLTMTVQINSYLTILMCFGALFPPLALIAAMSIYSITYFEELWIGWVLTETRGLGLGYGWYEEQIERECEGVEESSNLTIWSTLVVSCCLYGYMIFDTMGDRVGWEGALPMTLTMMLMPLVCYGGIVLHREWVNRRSGSGEMVERKEEKGEVVEFGREESVEEGKEVIREGSLGDVRRTSASSISVGGGRTISTIELAPRLTDSTGVNDSSVMVPNPILHCED